MGGRIAAGVARSRLADRGVVCRDKLHLWWDASKRLGAQRRGENLGRGKVKTVMSAQGGIATGLATVGVCCLLASRIGEGRGSEVWLAIVGCVLLGFSGAVVLAALKRRLTGSHGGPDGD